MRKNNRNSIASMEKLPQFTTMNVIDGQAGLVIYSSLIFYSLTIDNILNIIVVIVTIIINVRENKKYINSLKPLLSFSLYEMNGLLLLLVKNNGQSEAKNIRIKVLELKNNGSNSKLMLDAIFNEAFMLYPTEETQGIIAISGRNVETDIFPQVKLDISFIEGNDNKKIEYCRTITFKRKMEEKDRLENIEDSIESISDSNNRMANYRIIDYCLLLHRHLPQSNLLIITQITMR